MRICDDSTEVKQKMKKKLLRAVATFFSSCFFEEKIVVLPPASQSDHSVVPEIFLRNFDFICVECRYLHMWNSPTPKYTWNSPDIRNAIRTHSPLKPFNLTFIACVFFGFVFVVFYFGSDPSCPSKLVFLQFILRNTKLWRRASSLVTCAATCFSGFRILFACCVTSASSSSSVFSSLTLVYLFISIWYNYIFWNRSQTVHIKQKTRAHADFICTILPRIHSFLWYFFFCAAAATATACCVSFFLIEAHSWWRLKFCIKIFTRSGKTLVACSMFMHVFAGSISFGCVPIVVFVR